MKKFLSFLAALLIVLLGPEAPPSFNSAAQFHGGPSWPTWSGRSVAQATALDDKLLKLFQNRNPQVSLGAMLIATGARDEDRKLEQYVRDGLKEQAQTVLERTVKLYFLALSTYSDEDMLAFVQAFPEDPQDFLEVLRFDSGVTQTISGLMVQEISAWTSCQTRREVREAARTKVERLRETKDQSGWAAEIFPYPQELQQCE